MVDQTEQIPAKGNVGASNTLVETTEPKRVKVYILENNEWKDTGTGFCIGEVNSDQSDGSNEGRTAYMVVNNEEYPGTLLLRSKLEGNIEYQRQEETLIVWKDLNGCDIALSFEESVGCDIVCNFIVQVQKQIESNISLVAVKTSLNGLDSVHEMITGPVSLPSNSPDQDETTLLSALKILNENTSFQFLKTQTTEFILDSQYIRTLISHFHKAETQQLTKDLFLLSNIVKTLVLYNNRDILETLIDDDYIVGIIGILEYDTEFPLSKANHRNHMNINPISKFKNVISWVNSELDALVKRLLRLQFLKDVVLVRFLGGTSLDLFLDIILDLQTCIIDFLQSGSFIERLVELYSEEELEKNTSKQALERRQDGIRLLHECIQMSKNIEYTNKSRFYKQLMENGLFKIMHYALNVETESNIRILATDVVITIVEHDILLVHNVTPNGAVGNNTDTKTSTKPSPDMSLLLILSTILLTDKNVGLREQVVQALQTLLHPEDCFGGSYAIGDMLNARNGQQVNTDLQDALLESRNNNDAKDGDFETKEVKESTGSLMGVDESYELAEYFINFYKQVAPTLFRPLIRVDDEDDIVELDEVLLTYLVRLISFVSIEHDRRPSREFILENGILDSVSKLMGPEHTLQLRLTALRCFKNIINFDDAFYNRYIISKELLAPIQELLKEHYNKDNLANSALQDLCKTIAFQCSLAKAAEEESSGTYKKTNFTILNNHLVEKYKDVLELAQNDIVFVQEMLQIYSAVSPTEEKKTSPIEA